MHLLPRTPTPNPSHRVLIVSDAPAVQAELAALIINPKLPLAGMAAAQLAASLGSQGPLDEHTVIDFCFTANGDQGALLVEAAVREVRPIAAVVIDWRVFHGRDCTQAVKRMWHAQRDLHVVVHAVFDQESRGHITGRLGVSHRLVVLKHELAPFEIARMAQTMAVKWKEERELSLLEAQLRIAPGPAKVDVIAAAVPPPAPPADASRKIHRLETVGRLTDGVAHDFNNFLTVIQGHLSVALASKSNNEKLVASVEEVLKEARRVSEMTRQLLAFNHREYLEPRAIRLEQAVDEEVNLLRRTLGEQITIEVDHEADLPPVMADPASLGQAVVSLAVRARDAMPQGGKLSIHTRRMHISNTMAAGLIHPEAKPGDFVVVALADGGKGMSSHELAKVFDPPSVGSHQGPAAGVGLVIVQELVRHQGGWISVTSVPEVGTEFSLHLPSAKMGTAIQPVSKPVEYDSDDRAGKDPATILIVDDEDSVRQVMEFVLVNQGHTVIAAKDANEGWSMWCKHSRTINLAIVDIKLPGGISGFDLERAIAEEDCTVPVVFTCGYCPTALEQKKELQVGVNYLPKPFGMAELLNIVNKAILQPMKF